jgi:hypothetical protein
MSSLKNITTIVHADRINEEAILLENECADLFRHLSTSLDWQNVVDATRQEAFFGKTIGSMGLLSRGFALKPKNRKRNVPDLRTHLYGDSFYKVNDLKGTTRFEMWNVLTDHHCGRKVYDSVLDMLRMLLKPDDVPECSLQCNVNRYRWDNKMVLHRDDCSNKGIARTDTFYGAAVTCLLFSPSLRRSKCQPGFVLYVKPGSEKVLFEEDVVADEEKADSLREIKRYEVSEEGCLYGLTGEAYKNGLHKGVTNWTHESGIAPSYDRMSLNFRVVRPVAWKDLSEDGFCCKLDNV